MNESTTTKEQRRLQHALATYGMQGIDPIMDIVGSTITEEVKTHGLDAVKRIREKLK